MGRGARLLAPCLAAAGLSLLTGCASQRAIQHLGDAAVTASPLPMLRAMGPAAPTGGACRAHDPTPGELVKQRRVIDPLKGPGLYSELFYGPPAQSQAAINVDGMVFRRHKEFDDAGSGLSGFVLLDDASGHALVLFKGMDRPFAERDGWRGVFTDLGEVLAAKFGTGNDQLRLADGVYTEVLCDEAVQSIEVVGYSMGSQIANHLAVKYGAYAVVFGDMGLDSALLKRHARGDLQAARAQAREHVVSLSLNGDVLVKLFGVGEVVGNVVKLPGILVGVFHAPEIYANAANSAIRDRDAARDKAAGTPMQAAAGASGPHPDASRNSNHGRSGGLAEAPIRR